MPVKVKKSTKAKALPNQNASSQRSSIWINGLSGRMGQAIVAAVSEYDQLKLLGGRSAGRQDTTGFKGADIIIDFSSIEGNKQLFHLMSKEKSKTLLIGTTGLSEQALKDWRKLAEKNEHKILHAPNTSIGIYLLMHEVRRMAQILVPAGFDIEIIETHHNRKKDAPSGTALLLAHALQKDYPDYKITTAHTGLRSPKSIGVHAVRGGGVFGEHVVRFISEHEEVNIGHRAFSRSLFAHGVLSLVQKLKARDASGFVTLEKL